MEKIILGRLAGLEATNVLIQLGLGEIHVFSRQELDFSLQQACENLGHMVTCVLNDGIVTKITPSLWLTSPR